MKTFFKLILLLMLFAPAALAAQPDSLKQKAQPDSLAKITGFPVAPFHNTLFLIYNRQGSFTPAERAEAVSNRIGKLSDDISFNPDSLVVVPSELSVDVLYKDNILISVTDKDAL